MHKNKGNLWNFNKVQLQFAGVPTECREMHETWYCLNPVGRHFITRISFASVSLLSRMAISIFNDLRPCPIIMHQFYCSGESIKHVSWLVNAKKTKQTKKQKQLTCEEFVSIWMRLKTTSKESKPLNHNWAVFPSGALCTTSFILPHFGFAQL